ncbi:endo-1,3(4)-beta-glucanase [Plectosphaerella plurivora]|uniref:glucan endo-1,3-beta-D-glucosidase n=1 Tax=Plectosphaerella plurivora TaxID=936078 RepID=A0A9P8V5S2_9PEZI|nr:endo-1,3(4)-beta-glucanase [Plectosphaerella plurivora]
MALLSAMASSNILTWVVQLTLLQVTLDGHARAYAQQPKHSLIQYIPRQNIGASGSQPVGLPAQNSPPGNGQDGRCGTRTFTTTVSIVVTLSARSTTPKGTGTTQLVQQSTITDRLPQTSGYVNTSLDLGGRPTSCPIITAPIPSPTSLIATSRTTRTTPLPTSSVRSSTTRSSSSSSSTKLAMPSGDIFAEPIATAAPPSQIGSRNDHPQAKMGVTSSGPIQTNKFFGNFMVGDQAAPSYTFPYSVVWAAGKGATGSFGLAISHIEANQRVFGNNKPSGAAAYFINPVGIQSMIVSAKELGQGTALSTDSITAFSARVHLRPNSGAVPAISFPLVQGMAFVTAQFAGATPVIQTGVFFKNVTRVTQDPKVGVSKFNFHLEDGRTWRVYAHATTGQPLDLRVVNNAFAEASRPFFGTIQVAKDPGNAEAIYDEAAGVFPTTMTLSAQAENTSGSYTFKYAKAGHPSGKLLMYALPHHVDSFDAQTRAAIRNAQLQTPTKGIASAALAKFATMLVVINDILEDPALAQQALGRLKEAFSRFALNRQKFPLVYERSWGGIVSTGSYVTGNSGADFGNTYYNDHHFHYGYHVLAAACIGHLDPSWIPENKAYVNTLVRDYANPSARDQYFPQWRSFDWYHGHSWAHGLFPSTDGKDQESSSEDMMQAYAVKMWGMVTGDAAMAMRGNLQLSVLARSLQHYYLYTSDNKVQPAQFIGNKVAGIMFENKIDHTTYFGANIEYIQGIHMIPLLPPSPLIRTRKFVQEEWDVYFSGGRAEQIQGGWRGIIFGNLATLNPRAAWDFFNARNFDPGWVDGGASLTWYLAYAAGEYWSFELEGVAANRRSSPRPGLILTPVMEGKNVTGVWK